MTWPGAQPDRRSGEHRSQALRPAVDVVVPFRGRPAELARLRERLAVLRLGPGDSLTVIDNAPETRGAVPPGSGSVVRAAEVATPAYARNNGALRGTAEWIVFLDADTVPPAELLDRYFEPPPNERTALIGGAVVDEPGAGIAARYAELRAISDQEGTYRFGRWAYPKTTNVAVRRAAFDAVGGFRDGIRAAEDADLAYRLRAAGWGSERREAAAVMHRNRHSVRGLVVQRLVHGSGGAWIDRIYPGAMPARRLPGLVWWALRATPGGLLAAARARDRDAAILALLGPLDEVAFELGRSIPNRRPVGGVAAIRWRRWTARVSRS